nr:MAG: hypothetical protein [Bee densovirus 6]
MSRSSRIIPVIPLIPRSPPGLIGFLFCRFPRCREPSPELNPEGPASGCSGSTQFSKLGCGPPSFWLDMRASDRAVISRGILCTAPYILKNVARLPFVQKYFVIFSQSRRWNVSMARGLRRSRLRSSFASGKFLKKHLHVLLVNGQLWIEWTWSPWTNIPTKPLLKDSARSSNRLATLLARSTDSQAYTSEM